MDFHTVLFIRPQSSFVSPECNWQTSKSAFSIISIISSIGCPAKTPTVFISGLKFFFISKAFSIVIFREVFANTKPTYLIFSNSFTIKASSTRFKPQILISIGISELLCFFLYISTFHKAFAY